MGEDDLETWHMIFISVFLYLKLDNDISSGWDYDTQMVYVKYLKSENCRPRTPSRVIALLYVRQTCHEFEFINDELVRTVVCPQWRKGSCP